MLIVKGVVPGSKSDIAGILSGDKLISVNGVAVYDFDDIVFPIKNVILIRGNAKHEITLGDESCSPTDPVSVMALMNQKRVYQ